jgi:AAA15 family ATPase/GTPase
MRIKKIELKNFKRFTELAISDIPDTSKLVLIIGSNGAGKSCLFDAFDWLSKGFLKPFPPIENYYRKDHHFEPNVFIEFWDNNVIEKNDTSIKQGEELVKKFLGRSSIRIVPRILNTANPTDISIDRDSPLSYIENDTRFINDVFAYIQQINKALREPVFSGKQADTIQIFKNFIDPLNYSLLKILGGNETTTIQIAEFQEASAQTPATLIFKKGKSKINYDLLSHGEKQIVILLINFIVRYEYYQDSIIFIDEMDSHLNTALQLNLLKEIVSRWIPDNSQLWTASHALGFIDYAKNSETASIIDFDLFNFDTKKELFPLPKEKMEVCEIAIPKSMITSILKNYKLVVVENKNDEYFNAALGEEGYLFLPANNNREVFLTIKNDTEKLGLRDRDYLRSDEIAEIKQKLPHFKILTLSTFENYIYHPDNIQELDIEGFNKENYIAEIIKQKNEKLLGIVGEIGIARNHYIEFKDCIKNDGNIDAIIEKLKSDVFDDFYIYFNMKKHFNKHYIEKLQCTTSQLCQTKWFKHQIFNTLQA